MTAIHQSVISIKLLDEKQSHWRMLNLYIRIIVTGIYYGSYSLPAYSL